MRLRYRVFTVMPAREYLGVEEELILLARCRELRDALSLARYVGDRGRVGDGVAGPGSPLVYLPNGEPSMIRPPGPVPATEPVLFRAGWELAGVFYGSDSSPAYVQTNDSGAYIEVRVRAAVHDSPAYCARRLVSAHEADYLGETLRALLAEVSAEVFQKTGALAFTGALTQTGPS